MSKLITALSLGAGAVLLSLTPALATTTMGVMMVADINHESVGLAQNKNVAPKILAAPQAEISELDRKMGHNGTVIVQVELDAAGKVTNMAIAKSSGFRNFDNSALSAIRATKFQAEKVAGSSVGGVYAVSVDFNSQD